MGDVLILVGAIGGSAILALFDKKTDLFDAYSIGLAVGFFGYFLLLLVLVIWAAFKTGNFNVDCFLDGRRKAPQSRWG